MDNKLTSLKRFGIDLSYYQSKLDLLLAKNEGIEFVILRAGYTGYSDGVSKAKDKSFELFYNKCKELNIPVGAYWFTCANTYQKGVDEAEWMYSKCLLGKQFEYPIYIDVEDDSGKKYYLRKSGKANITEGIRGFCSTLEKKGYYVGVYATPYWFNNYIDQSIPLKYDCWVATWSTIRPSTPLHGMWQYGGDTNLIRSKYIAGIACDQDYAYIDYPTIMKNIHKNGF